MLQSKGDFSPTSDADIDAAVGRLVDAGTLLSDEAAALRALRGDWPRRMAQEVAIEVARLRGYDPRERPDVVPGVGGAGTQGTGFYRADVRDPAAWQGAADARQEHIRFYREKAVEAGDFGLAEALAGLGTSTERQTAPAQRKVIARAIVKAAPAGQAGLRRAAMAPWLRGEEPGDGA